ncbi:MAG: beta-ketoacyl synthase chain length factor [Desulfobacterales bacterium]|nr:beta-ketoacyl synthase chain length factor [Desulfobacterales bacterium]
MSEVPIYIAGLGAVSALARGTDGMLQALLHDRCGLGPLDLFPVASEAALPVGQVDLEDDAGDPLPRTHRLAGLAADQTMAEDPRPLDAIVLGTTTGGILTTEALLQSGATDPAAFRYHGLGTIAEVLARRCACRGPLITVSTACSSGAVAIALAMALLRRGLARRVLAGGADSLCRLTYFGFKALQLIDPLGARPLDRERRGMSVAEGAGMLLLTSEAQAAGAPQLLGAGLSCDAHHATTPHPEGRGALAAMQAALADAGLAAGEIDYINLHGTGTLDNDLAEARAVSALFGERPPPLSSIKGATGHSLAAAGALEAVVAALAVSHGLAPANTGLTNVDAQLKLNPLTVPLRTPIATVLSNSFGFGGNNAALVIGKDRTRAKSSTAARPPLTIAAAAGLTGVGHDQATWERFAAGGDCAGCLDETTLCQGLPPRTLRRLKRLPKLALALAAQACQGVAPEGLPAAISLGTAWGALSETHDFLQRLFETGQQFPSPTDFIGSVHNAPAGQIAMHLGARGANVTTSGGDASFEQALLAADLLTDDPGQSILVVGVDEAQPVLAPLLDPSVRNAPLADGGGALLLRRGGAPGPTLSLLAYGHDTGPEAVHHLIESLGGARAIRETCGAVLAGIPAAHAAQAARDLAAFAAASGFDGPVIDYRRAVGQFGAASAVAAVLALRMVQGQAVPAALAGGVECPLEGKGVLLLGLGPYLSAVRIALP